MTVKLAIVYYSTYGTNHAMAETAASAARAKGAEVKLLKVAETAPQAVIDGQAAWKAQQEATKDIAVATPDDLAWADAILFSAPTRFGQMPSQLRAYIDTLGGVWSQGKLVNKAVSAMTSAQNPHGGQEGTILGLYQTVYHWGSVIVAPGYTSEAVGKAGGNPYGTSVTQGKYGEAEKAAVVHQVERLIEVAAKLK